MKKIFASMMAAAMVVSLAGCNGNGNSGEGGSDAAAAHKLGMGVCTSIGSSKAGTAQVDATVAAVVLDADGKIVSCKVDVAQNKMDITDGAVPEDASSMTFKSKKEKLEEYNMKPASAIGKEWYEQAEAFEAFVVGKTADEVAAIPVETTDNGHVVTTDETLKAGCTMSIDDLIDATVKACKDDSAADFTGDAKLALTCSTSVDSATASAADGEDGTAAMYTTFAAVAVASDGKLAAVCYDEVQPKVTFDAAGEITSDTSAEIKTKREKKEEYNMKGASPIGKEWYEQIAALEEYAVGKTVSEVCGMSTKTVGTHTEVPAIDELTSSCTIACGAFFDSLEAAAKNAK